MKRFFASILLLLCAFATLPAQDIGRDSLRTIYRSIQAYAYQSPTTWMDNYAWLQEKELPFFARDTFTMTWHFDPGTLLLVQENTPGLSWRAIFDPVWANGSREPMPERYEMQQLGCLEMRKSDQFIADISFEFILDTNLKVKEVLPQLSIFHNGYLRTLSRDELPEIDFRECIAVRYRGGESAMPTLVGAHHRKMKKIRARAIAEKEKISRLLNTAVREAYSGF
ncbi:MAG TPA: hypothetical protein ENJ82_00745, partial [Bacteroidetes bacterium]|nr:hypothetical protein [Bacteroidota bacterium]